MSSAILGIVKWFNPVKGFGIIKYNNGANEIYVHYSAITSNMAELEQNQKVQFIIGNGDQGTHAQRVSVVS